MGFVSDASVGALSPRPMPQSSRSDDLSPKFRTAALGFATAAALALPASAMADTSLLDGLSSPATIDGHKYSAQQMKHKFAGQKLYFVLGSKEEGAGAV